MNSVLQKTDIVGEQAANYELAAKIFVNKDLISDIPERWKITGMFVQIIDAKGNKIYNIVNNPAYKSILFCLNKERNNAIQIMVILIKIKFNFLILMVIIFKSLLMEIQDGELLN